LKEPFPIEKRETVAEGIAIANPVRGMQILEAIQETEGEVLVVTEKEIMAARVEMGKKGHFIEPTSAATVAGLKKYLKKTKKEIIVSTLTGMGLKATGKIGYI
jgi:threonine synthase